MHADAPSRFRPTRPRLRDAEADKAPTTSWPRSRAARRPATPRRRRSHTDGCTDDYGGGAGELHQQARELAEPAGLLCDLQGLQRRQLFAQGFCGAKEINCNNNGIYCNGLIRLDAADNLRLRIETTAVGIEITINQFTDLVSASIAVVGRAALQRAREAPALHRARRRQRRRDRRCAWTMPHHPRDGNKAAARKDIMEAVEPTSVPNLEARPTPS